MVSGISGIGSGMGMGMPQNVTELTDEQKEKLQEILEKYDAENMTAEDVEALFKETREAGIPPGEGLKEAMETAGFDLSEIRGKSGENAPPPPPPMGMGQASTKADISTLQSLQSILSQYDLSNLTSEEESELFTKLSESGLTNSGYLVNLGV